MENLFGEKIEKEVWKEEVEQDAVLDVEDVASINVDHSSSFFSPDPIITITYLDGHKISLHYSKLSLLHNKEILEYVNNTFIIVDQS